MAGANAEYVINVAATFEGAQTVAQLDQLTTKLVSSGTGADVFHDAIAKVTNQLTAAKAATVAANAALAQGNERYAALEKAANAASIAFEKAQKTGAVPPGVEASYVAATAAVNSQAEALKKLEAASKAATEDEKKLGVQLKNVNELSTHTAEKLKAQTDATNKAETAERSHERQLKKTAGAMNSVGGPLGVLGAKVLNAADDFHDMSESMGASKAAAVFVTSGIASVVTAVVAVTAVLTIATVALAGWAVGLADTARSAALTQQAVDEMDPKIAALSDSYAGLTNETGQTATQLNALVKSLEQAHVKASDMPAALRAAATAEAALGQGGSAQFLADITAGKKSVEALSSTVQSKLGGIVAKQMMSLTNQSGNLKQNFAGLFGGLNIDPVLSGVSRLVALFDKTTESGSAIKTIFEGLFQPLINSVDKASVVIEAFVLGVLIGLTKLYIQAKPVIKAVGEFFGFDNPATADNMATITAVAEKLVPVLVILAGVFTAIAAVVGVGLAAALAIAVAPLALISAALYGVIKAAMFFKGIWDDVVTFLNSISPKLVDIGGNIIMGLVNGILGGGPAVLKALGGVVSSAVDGAKNLLGIHSPSKVFAEIGHNTGAGMAQGLDASTGTVQEAMSNVVEPPAPSASAPSPTAQGAGAAKSSAKQSPDLSGAIFNFYGVKDAESAKESFGEMLTAFLEGDAAKLGNAKMATT